MRRLPVSLSLVSALAFAVGLSAAQGCAPGAASPAGGELADDEGTSGAGGGGASTTTDTETTSVGGAGGALGVGGAPSCGAVPNSLRGPGITDADQAVFDTPPAAAAPFVFDPPSGAVLPAGWPSPSFLVHSTAMPKVVRLTISMGVTTTAWFAAPEAATRSHDDALVTGAWWTVRLPADVWSSIRCGGGDSLAWSVSYAMPGEAAPGGATSGSLSLLETVTKPDMSYWEIGQSTGGKPDDFSIRRLAIESGVPQTLVGAQDGCIGCHTSSPDGQDIAYQRANNFGWVVEIVRPTSNGPAVPSPAVTPAAKALLDSSPLTVPATSPGAWGDATGRWLAAVTSSNGQGGRLGFVQVDSASPSLAVGPALAPDGKSPLGVASPALSPDGTRVVFTATPNMVDGYFAPTGFGGADMTADLWQLPVTLKKGAPPVFGAPSPIPFASGTAENETYPTFSRDGKLLAFMRSGKGRGGYDEVTGEIWVMPADGSKPAVRLAANDAPKDASVYAGPGLTSSWPRFGESSVTTADGTWYLLLFSSRRGSAQLWRDDGGGSSPVDGRPIGRLYLTTVLVGNDGAISTFPAALVPGQRVDAGAHTATFTTVTSVPPPAPK